jgi:hypothetical protein
MQQSVLMKYIQMQMGSIDKWKQKYPLIADVIEPVAKIVAQLRNHPSAELEARFGVFQSAHFKPGVCRIDIDRIMSMMIDSPHVDTTDEWTEEQDFFFMVDGKHCRTRVRYDSSNMCIKPQTIVKEAVATQDIFVEGPPDTFPNDIRISLKTEDAIVQLQPCVSTTLVRIKQRRRFITNCKKWAFDFSMIWSGANKDEAEINQSQKDPHFEIECELIDAQRVLDTQDDARIACSLLLKMTDLLPSEYKYTLKRSV